MPIPTLCFNKAYIAGFMGILRSKFKPRKDYAPIGLYTIERDEGYVVMLYKGELLHYPFYEEDVVDEWVKSVFSGDLVGEVRKVSLADLQMVL